MCTTTAMTAEEMAQHVCVSGVTGERGGGAAEGAELRPNAAEEGRRLVERPRQLLLVPLQHPAVRVLHTTDDIGSVSHHM
jgi:hypothetical protein